MRGARGPRRLAGDGGAPRAGGARAAGFRHRRGAVARVVVEGRAAASHEWLIDALIHSEPTIRHEASEELKRLTGQYFGYCLNLPRRERERAHQQY